MTLLPADAAAQELDLGSYPSIANTEVDFNLRVPHVVENEGIYSYVIPADTSPCTLCKVIQVLAAEAESFTVTIANTLYPHFLKLFDVVFTAWLVIVGIRLVAGIVPNPVELGTKVLLGLVLYLALAYMTLWWEFIYILTRDVLLAIAMAIVGAISKVQIPPNAIDFSPFAQIFGIVENSLMSILMAGYSEIIKPPTGGTLKILGELPSFILRLIMGGLLMIPYAFVLGIFAAYIVEGIFKFLAVTALAPIWVACAFLPRTRGFTEAAIRIYLSGGLTIVFAAVAMGFTMAVTHTFTAELVVSVNKIQAQEFFLSWGYWAMLLLGFISVLLHLKAAMLASNISGANDGAGPAAATVAGGKLAVAAAVTMAVRASGGRGLAAALAPATRYGIPGAAVGGAAAAGRVAGATSSRVADLARRMAAGRGQ